MKKNFFIPFLSIILVICISVSLSACNSVTSGSGGESGECSHKLQHIAEADATCTEDGNTEYWYCSDCGKYYSDAAASTEIMLSQTLIPATGHTLTKNQAAANCIHKNNLDYWYCANCGNYFFDEDAVTKMTENQKLTALLIAPPENGSLPTAYSGAENIVYMAYTLAHQNEWHAESYNLSVASINYQRAWSYIDCRDDVCILSYMNYSSFIKNSSQTLFKDGGAYIRGGSTPENADGDISSITWENAEPTYYGRETYYTTYGLFANELSAFILNNDTILSASEVTLNTDGTYTQSFTLNPDTSAYYYQYALKSRSGLSENPTFSTITISFTFNSNWKVLKIVSHEDANIKMAMIATTNQSDTETVFTYGSGSADDDILSCYENYFINYIGIGEDNSNDDASSEIKGQTDSDILKNGFSNVLSESGGQFQIDINYDATAYSGYLYAQIDTDGLADDALASLNLRLSLNEADNQILYCDLTNGKINLYYSESFAENSNLTEINTMAYNVLEYILTLLNNGDYTSEFWDVITFTEANESIILEFSKDLLNTDTRVYICLHFVYVGNEDLSFEDGSIDVINSDGEETTVSIYISETETITHNTDQTPLEYSESN